MEGRRPLRTNTREGPMAKLTSIHDYYIKASDISEGTAAQYRFAVSSLINFTGREPHVRCITSDVLNGWIAAQLDAGYSRTYVKNQRGAILTLLRFARRRGDISAVPDLVRPVKVLPCNPEAFTLVEVAAALAFCRAVRGAFPSGLSRGPLLFAVVLVAYFSGLRRCDLLSIRMKMALLPVWAIRQQKTGDLIYFAPPYEVKKAITATLDGPRDLLFPITKKALWYWWEQIEESVGRPSSMKWLRRSGATHLEIKSPGSAQAYLGHRTPGLAWRHYIDRTQVQQRKPLPPSPFGEAGS